MPESTVFFVDDDAGVRQWFIRLMEEIDQPVKAFASAAEFLEAFAPESPGCLVLDVRMPGMSGVELHRKLVADGHLLPVIMITGHGDVPMAVESMQLGAVSFLEKPVRSQQLVDCIQHALRADAKRRRLEAKRRQIMERVASMTQREREVVELAVAGMNNKEIAVKLGVSPQAIDVRRSHAMAKLGAKNIPELVKTMLRVRDGWDLPSTP